MRKAIPAIALCLATATGLAAGVPAAFAAEVAPAAEATGALSDAAEASYTVSYEFKSSVAWRTLNQEVKDLLPAAQADVADGTRVVPPAPAATEVRGNGGVWRFQGWDKAEATVEGADVKFVGTWKIEQYEPLFSDYHFSPSSKSVAAGHDRLPEEVLDLLPDPIEGLEEGTVITHPQPARTEVEVDGGKWVFDGWPVGNVGTMTGNMGTYATWTFVEDAPAPATADRVDLGVYTFVDGALGRADVDMLAEMEPALVSTDGVRVEPARYGYVGSFVFEFHDLPEGEYEISFSYPDGWQFRPGSMPLVPDFVDSGAKVQVKAGSDVLHIRTQLEPIPAAVDPTDPTDPTAPVVDPTDPADPAVDPVDPGSATEPGGADGSGGLGEAGNPGNAGLGKAAEGGGEEGETPSGQPANRADSRESASPKALPKTLPKTGDAIGIAAVGAVGAASAAAAALALKARRRRKHA